MTEINSEAIQKAKIMLGLIKAEDTDLVKAKKEESKDDSDEAKIKEADEKNEKLKKAKEEYDEHMKKASEIASAHPEVREAKMPTGSTEGDEEGKMPKVGTMAMKAEDMDLIKADFSGKIDAVTLLYKEKEAQNQELQKSVTDLTGKMDELSKLVEKIGKSSNGPKSLIKANAVERFAPVQAGEKQLSLSRNKQAVIDELVKAAGNDFGYNNIFAKAASCVEIAGSLGNDNIEANAVAQALRKLNGTVIVG